MVLINLADQFRVTIKDGYTEKIGFFTTKLVNQFASSFSAIEDVSV